MCKRCIRAIELEIQKALSPDLLKPKQKAMLEAGDHPSTGHCYIAAETAFHYVGSKIWKPVCIRLPEIKNTHWYVQNTVTGEILDPTKEQFGGKPPYDRGKGSGFLTKAPSRRARVVAERIQRARHNRHDSQK